jgi:hypothetical protein
MFKIIGADGIEYGPVSADQVRQWIAEGRADASTRIHAEESKEWMPLGNVPEFSAAFAAKPPPPPPPGGSVAAQLQPMHGALADTYIARDYDVDIGRCLSRGWELVTARFWPNVGVTALIILVTLAVESVPVLGIIALFTISGVFLTGLNWYFLKQLLNETVTASDAFAGFSLAFGALVLFTLIANLLTVVGCLLLILPGLYLLVAWMLFGGLLILDKQLDFWTAMELSRRVVTHHWFQCFGLFVVALLATLAGVLACGIGLFVSLPVATAAIVVAYQDIFCERAR